jgi:2-polyprenyl-3-methyl-5-hydroxy-6-metoxy-1,4-benzoquinol methylase
MPSGDYHESLWEAVPPGLEPVRWKLRLAFLLGHTEPGQRLLDVGCGEARFTSELAGAGRRSVGIDVAEEPLRRARIRDPQVDVRPVDPEQPWPLEDSSFDVVWAGEVIEHVADTATWLSEVRRVLRSGGHLLLSTPAHDRLTRLGLALSTRAFSTHFHPLSDHLRFYTRPALVTLLEDFGFEDVRVRGAGGVPGARAVLLATARRARF